MNWILFGFKGSGKTHFGRLLATRAKLPFIDTDHLIKERCQMSIPELVQAHSESYFRDIEREVIQNLRCVNSIIAVGGGSVLFEENLSNLKALGTLIYLKCPKELVKKRTMIPPLPTFIKNEDEFERIYSKRIKQYDMIPSLKVDLSGKSEKTILEQLWHLINSEISLESPHGVSHMEKP